MNTYTLTEIELTELLRKQRELVYNHARVDISTLKHNGEWIIRANYVTESFINAPPPPLPSGAKKEDIPATKFGKVNYDKLKEHVVDDGGQWLKNAEARFLKRKDQAISDINEFRKTHVDWAEHFEQNPEIEAKYVATGEWDSAKEHRRIIAAYDNVLRILKKEDIKPVPSKESQKQSLVEIMEADQRDGIYGVREIELLEKELERLQGIDVSKQTTHENTKRLIRISHVGLAIKLIKELQSEQKQPHG